MRVSVAIFVAARLDETEDHAQQLGESSGIFGSDCDRALAIRPDYPDALNNRGLALLALARHGEALASYDRALAIKPDYVEALTNRSDALAELARHEEAANDFERLLGIKPDYDYARGNMLHSRLHCCNWRDYSRNVGLIATDVVARKRAATPFAFLSVSTSARDQLRCAQTFSRDKFAASGHPLWQGERYRHDRIRVAYLSADFHAHAVAYLMAGLFEAHDKSRFETTAISFGPTAKTK
jgi:protein O-GlcNAc transferase